MAFSYRQCLTGPFASTAVAHSRTIVPRGSTNTTVGRRKSKQHPSWVVDVWSIARVFPSPLSAMVHNDDESCTRLIWDFQYDS